MNSDRLVQKYPPSQPCSCSICLGYCRRPGWWTVEEAQKVIQAGLASRMMLEISPEYSFGVLSPAFKGNELTIAMQCYADNKCTFLTNDLCELYGSGLQPLECRFCHHDRPGQGDTCHRDIEEDWHTPPGQRLVIQWCDLTNLWARLGLIKLGHGTLPGRTGVANLYQAGGLVETRNIQTGQHRRTRYHGGSNR